MKKHQRIADSNDQTKPQHRPGLPPGFLDSNVTVDRKPEERLIRLNEYWSYDPALHSIGLTVLLEQVDLKKLEAQTQTLADSQNARGWTVTFDYAATGEGRCVCLLRSHEKTEADARAHFRERFFADSDDQAWTYWNQGVEVHPGAYWPEYIKGYTTPPDELEMRWESIF